MAKLTVSMAFPFPVVFWTPFLFVTSQTMPSSAPLLAQTYINQWYMISTTRAYPGTAVKLDMSLFNNH